MRSQLEHASNEHIMHNYTRMQQTTVTGLRVQNDQSKQLTCTL